jgi:hypothetical protein
MINNALIIIAILLTIKVVNAEEGKRNLGFEFVGYDSLAPIFVSTENGWIMSKYTQHNVYKYANGFLTKMDIPIRKGSKLLLVKNGIYVFCDTLNGLTRLQFKLNGKSLVAQHGGWAEVLWPMHVTMNEQYMFILGGVDSNKGYAIFRIKLHTQAKIDTIYIKEYGLYNLLAADNEYLYYSTSVEDSDDTGPDLICIHQFNFKVGVTKKILDCDPRHEGVMIAPHINLLYISYNKRSRIVDYRTNHYASSPIDDWGGAVFFSYEHNAFVKYNNSSNIDYWQCLYLPNNFDKEEISNFRMISCFKK